MSGHGGGPTPPPQRAPAPPPPPATTPGRQVTTGCQTCPARPLAPCEVDKLKVKIIAREKQVNGEKTPLPLELETTRRRRGEAIPALRERYDAAVWRLDHYDFAIETLADSADGTRAGDANAPRRAPDAWRLPVDPEDLVQVDTVAASYSGLSCSAQAHSRLSAKVLGESRDFGQSGEILLVRPGAAELKLDPVQLYAKALDLGPLPSEGPNALLSIIAGLFAASYPKEVEFIASSCGRLPDGTRKPHGPNGELRAVLRIFRRDKWLVGFSLPPRSRTKAHGGSHGGAHMEQRTTPPETPGGEPRRQAVLVRDQGDSLGAARHDFMSDDTRRQLETRVREARERGEGAAPAAGAQANATAPARAGPTSFADTLAHLGESGQPDIVVAHNDVHIGAEDLRAVRDCFARFINWKERFQDLLTDLRDLLAVAPQVGWRLALEAKFFSGKVVLEWGPRQIKEPWFDGRLIPVGYSIKLKFQLQLVSFKLTVSFGFEFRSRLVELQATLSGSIELKAKIETDVDLPQILSFNLSMTVAAQTELEGKLELLACVGLCGYTVLEARLTLSTTLEAGVRLRINTARRQCQLGGDARLSPTLLTGVVRSPWLFRRRIDPPIQVFRGRDLGRFG